MDGWIRYLFQPKSGDLPEVRRAVQEVEPLRLRQRGAEPRCRNLEPLDSCFISHLYFFPVFLSYFLSFFLFSLLSFLPSFFLSLLPFFRAHVLLSFAWPNNEKPKSPEKRKDTREKNK